MRFRVRKSRFDCRFSGGRELIPFCAAAHKRFVGFHVSSFSLFCPVFLPLDLRDDNKMMRAPGWSAFRGLSFFSLLGTRRLSTLFFGSHFPRAIRDGRANSAGELPA